MAQEHSLTIRPISAFQDNYIWLVTNNKQAVIVDPGQAEPVMQVLAEQQLELTSILITHHHYDHTGGVKELLRHWPHAKVYAPATEALPAPNAIALQDNDTFTLPELGLTFDVCLVPGHTLGHIAYFAADGVMNAQGEAEPVLFCGDTLFSGGCGRLFEGSAEQMYHSLQRFSDLPNNTRVYCAHEYTQSNLTFCHQVEPNNADLKKHLQKVAKLRQQGIPTLPSSIGLEKAINVFLRAHVAGVAASAQAHTGSELNEDIKVFAALRRWKDSF
ncbi:hydroxyacylglutathione hydrolase [Oceanisphaera avium]|uniref:Hydroxyacylglutathione hydrolase n=1 Tax=Oceanisphaera avium TaxID=1903694 RepID=A0A1Y0CWK8_9GAMM|nr:hydroxyacylglutathione hydrolase [Oceanisphaera avium]ART79692.1 hydroxyacylglutathione hydrolase [Oceanisphaera avium]